jgi:parallel beta-helix repeat protein
MKTNTFPKIDTNCLRILFALLIIWMSVSGAVNMPDNTITVNTTSDLIDVSGKTCATLLISNLPGTDGKTSLREALCASNNTASGAPHIIYFSIGSGLKTISPLSALPPITRPVTIDGTTQPGYAGKPVIVLDGFSAGVWVDGLQISAGSTTVKGFVIQRFGGFGISLNTFGGNTLLGNYIGVGSDGLTAQPNNWSGLAIGTNASANIIGGSGVQDGNLISGNGDYGIYIYKSSSNQIIGNKIGVNASGTAAIANNRAGVYIYDAWGNVIGGMVSGAGNLISGNRGSGIDIYKQTSSSTQIMGNKIGTDATGTMPIPNQGNGVAIHDSPNTIIGGNSTLATNLISGNQENGILLAGRRATGGQIYGNKIGTNAAGTAAISNHKNGINLAFSSQTQVGNAQSGGGNLVSGNGRNGIFIDAKQNTVIGNKVGTNLAGTAALPNSQNGIVIATGNTNLIGGAGSGEGNLISGNGATGLVVRGPNAYDNRAMGNLIGVSYDGAKALPNGRNGVALYNAIYNTLGGNNTGEGNLISGNEGYGVFIRDGEWNDVLNNKIGTDSGGAYALGNTYGGIYIQNAIAINVGNGNLISGNGGAGVIIAGNHNQLSANKIGTNAAGTAALGNLSNGVEIADAEQNSLEDNLIASNNQNGVVISGSASRDNQLRANLIGINSNGKALGNGLSGLLISDAMSTTVGSSDGGNVIAYNKWAGVEVTGKGAWNRIVYNSIYANGGLGIDLGHDGVTANDVNDADNGPNHLQNYPTLSQVIFGGTNTRISGSFQGAAGASLWLQFFSTTLCDLSSHGEGQTYLGETTITTNLLGQGSFDVILPVVVPATYSISVTATGQPTGDTSEFSACSPLPKWIYLPFVKR